MGHEKPNRPRPVLILNCIAIRKFPTDSLRDVGMGLSLRLGGARVERPKSDTDECVVLLQASSMFSRAADCVFIAMGETCVFGGAYRSVCQAVTGKWG